MPRPFSDPALRSAVNRLVDETRGRCVLAGTVAAQIHLASALGLDKEGPGASAIEVLRIAPGPIPDRVDDVPVRLVDSRGFDASIAAGAMLVELEGIRYPVAKPEHVLGTTLASDDLGIEGEWASFALMRAMETRGIDLEEVRGFLKRCAAPDREVLLHELAYLAA